MISVQSEGENPQDPVKALVHCVVNTMLSQKGTKVARKMEEYRRNLSRRMFNLSDVEGQPTDMGRFYASFKAGWAGGEKEGTNFSQGPISCNKDLLLKRS